MFGQLQLILFLNQKSTWARDPFAGRDPSVEKRFFSVLLYTRAVRVRFVFSFEYSLKIKIQKSYFASF